MCTKYCKAKVLLSNYKKPLRNAGKATITLRPYEAVIYHLQ